MEYGTRKGVCRWMRGWLGGVEEEKRVQYVVDQVRNNGEVENATVNGRRWWKFGSCPSRNETRLHLYFIRAAPPSLTQLRQAKFSINPVNGVSLDNFAAALGRTGVIIRYLLRKFTYLLYYYYYLISRPSSDLSCSCPFGSGGSSSLDLFRLLQSWNG